MKFAIDHDLHNHSLISPCSRDDRQTKEAILTYALTNGFHLVGLSDHLWPDTRDIIWPYLEQLPQSKTCRFLKGAEVDMDMNFELLLHEDELPNVDYYILALTHVHLIGCVTDANKPLLTVEDTANYMKARIRKALSMDLPFERVGLAHITWISQPAGHNITECLALFSDEEWEDIFGKVAKLGMGVELNIRPADYSEEHLPKVLRPYQIAKKMGCKFYLGGDAHHPEDFRQNRYEKFQSIVDLLELTEDDKWEFVKQNRV
ncbi:MAG: hypothetical protein IJP35_05365 [Clostridia bacterium]|nr:hypothetical protein [Clostridia bacterium]